MNLTLGYVLIAAGFLLLGAELFVPSFGILLVIAVALIVVGVAMVFQVSTTAGLVTLIAVFVAIPLLGGVLVSLWPRTPLGRRFVLTMSHEDDTVAALPENQDLEQLRGRIGRTMSALRPAGVVDFDGRRIDSITEGMMVDPDQWVRCIDVKAGKVIVRPVDKPDLTSLENADFD
jgi:membrane-bound serine protease (ClpP class)